MSNTYRARIGATVLALKAILRALADYGHGKPRSRKFRVCEAKTYTPMNLNWEGGSKDYVWFYRMTDGLIQSVTQNPFNKSTWIEGKEMHIPADQVVIVHSFFCGKDDGITIYVPMYLDRMALEVALDAMLADQRERAVDLIANLPDMSPSQRVWYGEILTAVAEDRRKAETKTTYQEVA